MRPLIRLFFRTVRLVLTPFLLAGNWLTQPRGVVRTPEAQAAVDAHTRNLALYHYPACPFCIKTRRAMKRLSLDIELRNAQHDDAHRTALAAGGMLQVPCLLITAPDGSRRWLYESDAIVAHLNREFSAA